MLTSIKFSNYKRFVEQQKLELRPVTVLVGRNSSGKSSVSKLLPLLAGATSRRFSAPFMFENAGVSVGTSFADVCHNGRTMDLSFGLEFDNGLSIEAELATDATRQWSRINKYTLDYNSDSYRLEVNKESNTYRSNESTDVIYYDSDFVGLINKQLVEKLQIPFRDFDIRVDYIGPFRQIPERTIYSKGPSNYNKVGINGEMAYQVLCLDKKVEEYTSKWFQEVFDGCSLKVDRAGDGDYGAFHVNLYKRDSAFGVNIADEGQGMSQCLPIVVRANMSIQDSIVVVEQPELHLHPRAHASIARLLAITSKKKWDNDTPVNQRYVVETHSENILLGLRDAVVDKDVDFGSDDVIIYFIKEKDDGSSTLLPITISPDGELSSWPSGVFNESYELLCRIHEKAAR